MKTAFGGSLLEKERLRQRSFRAVFKLGLPLSDLHGTKIAEYMAPISFFSIARGTHELHGDRFTHNDDSQWAGDHESVEVLSAQTQRAWEGDLLQFATIRSDSQARKQDFLSHPAAVFEVHTTRA